MPPTVKKPEGKQSWRTVSELAKFLGLSTRTIERQWTEGRLPEPFRTDEGVKLWSPEQCEALLTARLGRLPEARRAERRITPR